MELNSEMEKIFISFVKTFSGESISIELMGEKKFGTDFITIISEQKNILYRNLNDQKGFYIISGEKKSGKTKTTYALIEEEVKKNKEIYSLEETILENIDFVNQILLDKKSKKEILVAKLIQNKPDLIAIDYIKPYILKTLFNYVKFGGKIILGIKNDIKTFVDILLAFDFEKAEIVRNFNILLEHKKFKKLKPTERKKIKISKEDWKILKSFIDEEEILELFRQEDFISEKVKTLKEIEFYTKTKSGKREEEVFVRGILDLGLAFEGSFLIGDGVEKIKNHILKLAKRSVLENALILSHKGVVDLKDILVYLTK